MAAGAMKQWLQTTLSAACTVECVVTVTNRDYRGNLRNEQTEQNKTKTETENPALSCAKFFFAVIKSLTSTPKASTLVECDSF